MYKSEFEVKFLPIYCFKKWKNLESLNCIERQQFLN